MSKFLVRTLMLTLALSCSCHSAHAVSSEDLYEYCKLFQASNATKLSQVDAFHAGICAGYANSFPTAYMLGAAAAKQSGGIPGKATPPQCYQPGKTQAGDVANAVIRRYEKDAAELKNESAELLLLLALRDELPCSPR